MVSKNSRFTWSIFFDICWNYQYLKSMIVFIDDLVVLTDLYYNRELLLSWQLKILCVGIKISYYAIKILT